MGHPMHFLDEVLVAVVDRRIGSEFLARAHLSSVPQVTITFNPNNLPSAIAMVPIPLVPPWTKTQSPSAANPRSNKLTQTVNSVSGIAAASAIDKRSGDRQTSAGRSDAIFGIATAGHERADLLADHLLGSGAGSHHVAGDFQAEDVGCSRRRRIMAVPLENVGAVDARRGDLDQDLVRPWLAASAFDQRDRPRRPAITARIEEGRSATCGLLT